MTVRRSSTSRLLAWHDSGIVKDLESRPTIMSIITPIIILTVINIIVVFFLISTIVVGIIVGVVSCEKCLPRRRVSETRSYSPTPRKLV